MGHRAHQRAERVTSQPIVLRAPHSPDECRRLLAEVTTSQSALSWHLHSADAGRPDPRLRGIVEPGWISVARWRDAAGRNSFAPWLNASLNGTGETTTLTGRVGLARSLADLLPLFGGIGSLIVLLILVTGVVGLAQERLDDLPFVLAPVGMVVFFTVFVSAGMRSLHHNTPELIAEINEILGSTAVHPTPDSPLR
jgi:hypothetical protein